MLGRMLTLCSNDEPLSLVQCPAFKVSSSLCPLSLVFVCVYTVYLYKLNLLICIVYPVPLQRPVFLDPPHEVRTYVQVFSEFNFKLCVM